MNFTNERLKEMTEENLDVAESEIFHHYGSFPRTFYTLYLAVSGGIDWKDASDPLIEISPILTMVFAMYITFAVLCVMNIITGVFVENAHQQTDEDFDQMIMEDLENRKQCI